MGGRRVVYNNQPVELLMDMARDSISASEPVWFGCEVSKRWLFKDLKIDLSWRAFFRYVAKQGFLDLTAHDYQLVFGVEVNFLMAYLLLMPHYKVQTGMDKASRLVFGDSLMTHAMVLTGCHVEGSSVTRSIYSQSCPSFPVHQKLLVQGDPCTERIPSHWI